MEEQAFVTQLLGRLWKPELNLQAMARLEFQVEEKFPTKACFQFICITEKSFKYAIQENYLKVIFSQLLMK